MSTTLPKTDLVRMAWIAALRRDGERKCIGKMRDRNSGNVCALGLLAEVAEISTGFFDVAGKAAGLSEDQTEKVWLMNDGDNTTPKLSAYQRRQHTFSEIADVVESWFSKA